MEPPKERHIIEITPDGWFSIAEHNAKLALRCSDPGLAEKFRERARKALQRLSEFELITPPRSDKRNGRAT
jgi:hypothetical protein